MISSVHYLIRSRRDGEYLVARIKGQNPDSETKYLLVFKEDFEALTYLNTHAPELSDQFAVESLPPTQLKSLIKRWGYQGIGVINDPIPPRIEFISV